MSDEVLYSILHEPSRLLLVLKLYPLECADFTYLVRETGLAKGNVSQHLQKLEEAGIVTITKEFVGKIPRTVIKLTDDGRKTLKNYKQNVADLLKDIET